MNKKKIVIYLAELAHNGFGLSSNTIPLGIGLIGSYCKKVYGDAIELRLFRQFDDLLSATTEQLPDIIGFGYYSWNDNLTLAAVNSLRKISPSSLIVLGGPNISFEGWDAQYLPSGRLEKLSAKFAQQNDTSLLGNNPNIDIIVHGDGEIPFANIIATFQDTADRTRAKERSIAGCSSLVDGKLITGQPVAPITDLDIIPSPYLSGIFDEFLHRFKLLPQIESVRGCPYECAYCTIGGNINKLRKHSFDYTKEEILYLKENSPNRVMRIADSNWGILKTDIAVAEFIKELHDKHGYPTSLRVYYAEKGPFENVKTMADTLKVLLPLNMSFQTLTDSVLHNVRRKNMPRNKVKEMVRFAKSNNISVSTELIAGLPGETYDSFRQVCLDVINLNFDSIWPNTLYLIKGSELYQPEAREKHKFKTLYSLIGKNVTKVDDDYIFEADEVVVESDAMSLEDFYRLHQFRLFITITYFSAFLKEIMMHCLNYNITPIDVYDEIFDRHPQDYPFFQETFSRYIDNVKNKYFTSQEELGIALKQSISNEGNVDQFSLVNDLLQTLGHVLNQKNKNTFIAEYTKACRSVYASSEKIGSHAEFEDILDFLGKYTTDVIISPLERVKERVSVNSKYDIVAWSQEGFVKPLSTYQHQNNIQAILSVRNFQEHQDLWDMSKDIEEDQKHLLYFRTMVSSNMRRLLTYA